MTSTDVCYICACACLWALSNTLPHSLKHDGTASEQRRPGTGHYLYCESGNLKIFRRDGRSGVQ